MTTNRDRELAEEDERSSSRAEAEELFWRIHARLGTGNLPTRNLERIVELDPEYAGQLAQQMYDRYETEIADLFRFGNLKYGQTTTRKLADDYEFIWQELVRKGARSPIVSSARNDSSGHKNHLQTHPSLPNSFSVVWTVLLALLVVVSIVGVRVLIDNERGTSVGAITVGTFGLVILVLFAISVSLLVGDLKRRRTR